MPKIENASQRIYGVRDTEIFHLYFKSNGSLDMNTTPKIFMLEDLPNQKIILNKLNFAISIDATIDLAKFGPLTLANGIRCQFGNSSFWAIKNNADVMSASTYTIAGAIITGTYNLLEIYGNGVICNTNDLKIVLRDNLSALSFFQATADGIIL